MLRHDPAEDVIARPWARLVGINFGRLAMRGGVIVLNDPDGLSRAINKMYLQLFPESVRPRTLISRNKTEIRNFAKQQGGSVVLKPLAGSGGRNVFLVTPEERANLNQMIESVMREGYVIAQEFLPKAIEGDTRLFMMNGRILEHKGAIAAVHRVRASGDIRSNITAGGKAVLAKVDDSMIKTAETARPRLVQDGMFLVGLDIVGDKLMEINVFSPGALNFATRLTGVNFTRVVIEAVEQKVDYGRVHPGQFSNIEMATL